MSLNSELTRLRIVNKSGIENGILRLMNKDRYIIFHINELLIDTEQNAEMLLTACTRSTNYKIQGLCQADEDILVILTFCKATEVPSDIRWVDITELAIRDYSSLLKERWLSGYEAIGSVSSKDTADQKRFLLMQRPANWQNNKN